MKREKRPNGRGKDDILGLLGGRGKHRFRPSRSKPDESKIRKATRRTPFESRIGLVALVQGILSGTKSQDTPDDGNTTITGIIATRHIEQMAESSGDNYDGVCTVHR